MICHRPEAGAEELVAIVNGWIDDGVPRSEIAVLTRVNSLLLAPHVALVEAGVPVDSMVSTDMLERTGIRAALAYLRLGADPDRDAARRPQEVLRRPSRGLPPWISKWLQRTMSIDDLRGIADRIDDDKVGAKVLGLADDLVVVAEAVGSGTTRDVLAVIADDVGPRRRDVAARRLEGWPERLAARRPRRARPGRRRSIPSPASFERWLRGVLGRRARTTPRPTAVTLSTVHRVKGMEWDRVVVAGVTEGVLPHRLAEDVEEERRVLHVAITRVPPSGGRARRCHPPVVVPRRARRLGAPTAAAGSRIIGADEGRPDDGRPDEARRAESGEDEGSVAGPAAGSGSRRPRRCGRGGSNGRRPTTFRRTSWRRTRSLQAIAVRRPGSLAELATVDGIGPTKLDLYGDEILAVLDAVADSS